MGKKKSKQTGNSDSVDIAEVNIAEAKVDLEMDEVSIDDHVNEGQNVADETIPEKGDSDLESVDVNDREEFKDAYNDPDVPLPTPPVEKDGVPGFNLVKASGISDTSAPSVSKSDLPDHATPSPIVSAKELPLPPKEIFGTPVMPPSPAVSNSDPTIQESKSKVFNKRMDYMINEFFVSIFQQKIKEKLGSHWAHVTAQPEVNSAIKVVQDMYETFVKMQRVIEKQILAVEALTIMEGESSLFFQQLGFQESTVAIHEKLVGLGIQYHESTKCRQSSILALNTFLTFIINFREKAIKDTLDTRDRQVVARQELDAVASRLGQMEERNLKNYAKSNHSSIKKNADFSTSSEKELEKMRGIFHDVKEKYKIISTQLIDKAGILQMKLAVDFSQQLELLTETLRSPKIVEDLKKSMPQLMIVPESASAVPES